MKKVILLLLFFTLFLHGSVDACTSVIISGKYTSDGRPIMWKHRDTSNENNKLVYVGSGKYEYIAMVNVGEHEYTDAWMGMNTRGFCIMNTASYNLNQGEDKNGKYTEGEIMGRALASCATLEEFEKLIESLERPTGLEANFGVIDARGGAAYYEVGDSSITKIDVNDRSVAPLGFLVMTNYSFSGDPETGHGYSRYITAYNLFYRAAMQNDLAVEFILRNAERNLVNGFTGVNLAELSTSGEEVKMVHFRDNIARRTSTSSAIFKGVAPGGDPAETMMWAVGGWPLASVAYPVWFNEEHILPELLIAPEGQNSEMCDMALKMKSESMPIKRGHGQDYININKIYNNDLSGYMQWIRPLEDEIIKISARAMTRWNKSKPNSKQIRELYKEIDRLVISSYGKNGYHF
ncbi:MAG: carcinine hydrolase/isopenicillin-N N-acyltransferase family protein [Bacteroidota bacterium]